MLVGELHVVSKDRQQVPAMARAAIRGLGMSLNLTEIVFPQLVNMGNQGRIAPGNPELHVESEGAPCDPRDKGERNRGHLRMCKKWHQGQGKRTGMSPVAAEGHGTQDCGHASVRSRPHWGS
eukprot:1955197-Heterocapsa_arctica.AAC.1